MKKALHFCIVLLMLSHLSWGKEIPPQMAAEVAKNFIRQFFATDSLQSAVPDDIYLVQTRSAQSVIPGQQTRFTSYYIFEFTGSGGFIILAADDRVYPVLGFSGQSGFYPDKINPTLQKWLEEYHRQIQYIINHEIPATPEIEEVWDALETGSPLKSAQSMKSVGPLVQTRWNQSPYFNDQCPYDSYYGERCVTGCVATAVAQIMKYWNYPEQGTGFHTYQHQEYGAQSANFGATTYNWAQMPNLVNNANNAVATLMYQVGVSVEMDYGVNGSSASTFEYSAGLHSGEYALKNYFGYKESLHAADRENYTDAQWAQLLQGELDQGRPLLYRGSGSGGGHAFVCDGYTGDSFFHFNWGWGGYQDGYFQMNALNPGGVGTGGGSGGFNSFHMAGIGIEPPEQTTNYDLRLYDNLTATPNPISYGQEFTAHFDVANFGQNGFNGDFCVALFDADVNFVDFVDLKSNWTLESNFHYDGGITFDNEGSLTYLPGEYTLAALYKPTGDNWKLIANNDNFTNLTEFNIEHSNDLEVYAQITLTPGPDIIQGQPFSVHLDIANTGDTGFSNTIDVSLYDLDGQFIETVDQINDVTLQAGYHWTNGVDFSSNGVAVEPATYLLALQYYTTNGGWQLAGSSYETNPIKVIVKAAPLQPDPYENNNSSDNPYVFYPSYQNNRYAFNTAGSSIHIEEDNDFYAVYLEQGYTYYLNGRLHDQYSSDNGEEYSNDCLVSLIVGDYNSDVYDDVMPEFEITAHSSGLAILHVASYFEGDKGTYLLDMQLTRTAGTGLEETELVQELIVYPNPAQQELYVTLPDLNNAAQQPRIEIISAEGKVLTSELLPVVRMNKPTKINISSLQSGIYTLRVTADQVMTRTFIKQ